MKCPECMKLGCKSSVYIRGTTMISVYHPPYYDEDGVYTNLGSQAIRTEYECSNGHSWEEEGYGRERRGMEERGGKNMNVYVWEKVDVCSNKYHTAGGVVVFAPDEIRAREIANNIDGCKICEKEKPDYVRKATGKDEKVFIFPDAGCC